LPARSRFMLFSLKLMISFANRHALLSAMSMSGNSGAPKYIDTGIW